MKVVRKIAFFIIGFVFCLSGVFKLADPVGTTFIVSGYFNFLHLWWLDFSSAFLARLLAFVETVVGAALLTGFAKKITGIVSAVMLGFFTLLTLLLLIFNPEMDCGCFGEVVHLTHLQSFLKNVVLDLLWVAAFIPFGNFTAPSKSKVVGFFVATVSLLGFAIWSSFNIPALDFTAFAPGEEIILDGDISENAVLPFCDADGIYRDSAAVAGKVLVVSVPYPDRLKDKHWRKIDALFDAAGGRGYSPLLLVASAPPQLTDVPSALPAFSADPRTLLTLNRSNGGAAFVSDGLIVRKWPLRHLPSEEDLTALSLEDATASVISENTPSRLKFQGFLLYVFAVLLLL